MYFKGSNPGISIVIPAQVGAVYSRVQIIARAMVSAAAALLSVNTAVLLVIRHAAGLEASLAEAGTSSSRPTC